MIAAAPWEDRLLKTPRIGREVAGKPNRLTKSIAWQ